MTVLCIQLACKLVLGLVDTFVVDLREAVKFASELIKIALPLMSVLSTMLYDISFSIMRMIRKSQLRIVSLFFCIVLLMAVLLIRDLNWLM